MGVLEHGVYRFLPPAILKGKTIILGSHMGRLISDKQDITGWTTKLLDHQVLGLGGKKFFPECVARVPVSLWGSGG